MKTLIATVDLFDDNIHYRGKRSLERIPPPFLKTIHRLGKCEVIKPSHWDLYNAPQEIYSTVQESSSKIEKVTEDSIESKYYGAVTTYLYPNSNQIIAEMLDNKVDVNLIVAENLMDKYTLNSIHLSKNSSKTRYSISIFRQRSRLPFVCTYQLLLSYASVEQERKYDSKYILGSDSDALRWAKELFEYYHEDATAVTEL